MKYLILLTIGLLNLKLANAAGGIAEMKALTGDAPYLAPEYFGEALARQYYTNPAYSMGGGSNYRSRFYNNAANSYRAYGIQGYTPYSGYSGYQGGPYQGGPYQGGPTYPSTGLSSISSIFGGGPAGPRIGGGGLGFGQGGIYSGSGNEWVKKVLRFLY